jgi:membrane protease YdiL (CAAX protease family)
VPTRRDLAWVVVGVVVPLAVQIGLILVGSRLGVRPVAGGIDAAAAVNPVLVYSLALVSALFLIGPVEELLYRGVMQGRLRQSFGPVAAIGLTSVGFAAGHVATLVWGGDPFTLGFGLSLIAIATGSVVLGVIYERTGNLVPAILAHSLFNGLLIATALATVCEPVSSDVRRTAQSSLLSGIDRIVGISVLAMGLLDINHHRIGLLRGVIPISALAKPWYRDDSRSFHWY